MKTKNPKCVKCGKVMKVIYTKETYKLDDKYKTYWSKKGYICSHLNYPFVILKPFKEYTNYLVDILDFDFFQLKESLRKIFKYL